MIAEPQSRFFKFLPNRLGYLARYVEPIPAQTSIDDARALFLQDPDIPAMPLEQDGGTSGFVTREAIFHTDSRGGLFHSKKLIDLSEGQVDIHDAMESVYGFVSQDQASRAPVFMIYHGGRYLGMCTVFEVLTHAARLQGEDLARAKDVQERLIHVEDSSGADLELAWHYQMAHEVGGDFIQFRRMTESLWCLGVFDMAGKGVAAALATSLISSFFETLEMTGALAKIRPGQMVAMLHKLLRRTIGDNGFLASAFLFVDLEAKNLSVFNCALGSIYAYSTGPDGKVRSHTLEPNLPPLGIDSFPVDAMKSSNFKLGSTISLFLGTDGLTDMRGPLGDTFSEEQLKTFILEHGSQRPQELKKELCRLIDGFIGSAPQADDITFAILECSAGSGKAG